MKIESFEIDSDKVFPLIIGLLMGVKAETRALRQFLIEEKIDESDIDFQEKANHLFQTNSFHFKEVVREVYEEYASVRGVFPEVKPGPINRFLRNFTESLNGSSDE